jgi:L-asparaginase II
MTQYVPLFELIRADLQEALHFGALAVATAEGRLVAYCGDPELVVFTRSAAKPFQALPFLEQGGQAHYGLTQREVALMCASHAGTDEHMTVLHSLQSKTQVSEADLLCGAHPLTHGPTVEAMRQRGEATGPNRNNCSGKHTGMVAFARMLSQPAADYINPAHPIQQAITQAVCELCGLPRERLAIGIDGCSAPNFALPLRHIAQGYARLCDPAGLTLARAAACCTATEAMRAHPDMVGGPESFDTALMKALGGKLMCKVGAEGFQGVGLLPGALGPGSPALGIALKIADGDLGAHSRGAGEPGGHARPAVILEVLRQLGAVSAAELETLAFFGPRYPLQNWRKLHVGDGRPCFELSRV